MAVEQGRRAHRAALATVLALLAAGAPGACGGGADVPGPKPSSHPLTIGGLPFPPIETPLTAASPQLQRVVEAFEAFIHAAELPEVDKHGLLELSPEAIVEHKRHWIDEQFVRRFQRLRAATAELDALAAQVTTGRASERVAATALAGCAQRMLRSDWASLTRGSGVWMLGPKASVPVELSQGEAAKLADKEQARQAEVDAYFEERSRQVRAPRQDAGLAQLQACVDASDGQAQGVLGQWRAFCEEWMR